MRDVRRAYVALGPGPPTAHRATPPATDGVGYAEAATRPPTPTQRAGVRVEWRGPVTVLRRWWPMQRAGPPTTARSLGDDFHLPCLLQVATPAHFDAAKYGFPCHKTFERRGLISFSLGVAVRLRVSPTTPSYLPHLGPLADFPPVPPPRACRRPWPTRSSASNPSVLS